MWCVVTVVSALNNTVSKKGSGIFDNKDFETAQSLSFVIRPILCLIDQKTNQLNGFKCIRNKEQFVKALKDGGLVARLTFVAGCVFRHWPLGKRWHQGALWGRRPACRSNMRLWGNDVLGNPEVLALMWMLMWSRPLEPTECLGKKYIDGSKLFRQHEGNLRDRWFECCARINSSTLKNLSARAGESKPSPYHNLYLWLSRKKCCITFVILEKRFLSVERPADSPENATTSVNSIAK